MKVKLTIPNETCYKKFLKCYKDPNASIVFGEFQKPETDILSSSRLLSIYRDRITHRFMFNDTYPEEYEKDFIEASVEFIGPLAKESEENFLKGLIDFSYVGIRMGDLEPLCMVHHWNLCYSNTILKPVNKR